MTGVIEKVRKRLEHVMKGAMYLKHSDEVRIAQTEAILALAEQQRIANLIALFSVLDNQDRIYKAEKDVFDALMPGPNRELDATIAANLGITDD